MHSKIKYFLDSTLFFLNQEKKGKQRHFQMPNRRMVYEV